MHSNDITFTLRNAQKYKNITYNVSLCYDGIQLPKSTTCMMIRYIATQQVLRQCSHLNINIKILTKIRTKGEHC